MRSRQGRAWPSWLLLAAVALGAAWREARADQAGAAWQYRLAFGGELNVDPHGVFDLGFRKRSLSIELLTDTLEVRYAPEWSLGQARGKAWVAGRIEALLAGLFASPWKNGAPDPDSAYFASYGGAEGGWQIFLPRAYLGLSAWERVYLFTPRGPGAASVVPGPTSLLSADAMVGHYQSLAQVEARLGFDLEGVRARPHATLFFAYHPPPDQPLSLLPLLELRAGWALDATPLTRFPVGGLNPYVVPLAGAAWAELRAERFVAGRLGATLRSPHVDGGLLLDAVAFDRRLAAGLGALLRGRLGRWFAEATVGWSPWLPRQPGYPAVSAWVLLGTGWGPLRGR